MPTILFDLKKGKIVRGWVNPKIVKCLIEHSGFEQVFENHLKPQPRKEDFDEIIKLKGENNE